MSFRTRYRQLFSLQLSHESFANQPFPLAQLVPTEDCFRLLSDFRFRFATLPNLVNGKADVVYAVLFQQDLQSDNSIALPVPLADIPNNTAFRFFCRSTSALFWQKTDLPSTTDLLSIKSLHTFYKISCAQADVANVKNFSLKITPKGSPTVVWKKSFVKPANDPYYASMVELSADDPPIKSGPYEFQTLVENVSFKKETIWLDAENRYAGEFALIEVVKDASFEAANVGNFTVPDQPKQLNIVFKSMN